MEILVLFHSRYGTVYELAKAVADGIRQVEGVTPRLRHVEPTAPWEFVESNERWYNTYRRIRDEVPLATLDDLTETEGLVMGSPTRYGNIAPALGNFLEGAGPLWASGALNGKVGGVFGSTNTMHGGNEATLITMMLPLMALGYIIVPLGYTDPGVSTTDRGGTPYGPTAVAGPNDDQGGSETELHLCRVFGRRLAEVTKKLRSDMA